MRMAGSIALACVVALLFPACSKSEDKKPAEPPPAKTDEMAAAATKKKEEKKAPEPAADPVEIYLGCIAAFNGRDMERFSSCYQDATSFSYDNMPVMLGDKKAIVELAGAWRSAMSDVLWEPQLVLSAEKVVVALVVIRGTHDDTFKFPTLPAAPASNKQVGTLAVQTVSIDDEGKIFNERVLVDFGSLLAQMTKGDAAPPPFKSWNTKPDIARAGSGAQEKANDAVVKKIIDAFNGRQLDDLDELESESIVVVDQAAPAPLEGRAARKKQLQGYLKAFSALDARVLEQWAAGDYVYSLIQFRGINDGPLPPLVNKPTNLEVDLTGIEIRKLDGGLVTNEWLVLNTASLARQLGQMPESSDQ